MEYIWCLSLRIPEYSEVGFASGNSSILTIMSPVEGHLRHNPHGDNHTRFSHRRLLHSYTACCVSGGQKHTSELFPSVLFHRYKSKWDVGQRLKKCQSVLRVKLLTEENKGRQGKQTETGYIRKRKKVLKQRIM